jgi:hypothetical protein
MMYSLRNINTQSAYISGGIINERRCNANSLWTQGVIRQLGQQRWKHTSDDSKATTALTQQSSSAIESSPSDVTTLLRQRRRPKRRKPTTFSPLSQITNAHPKNASYPPLPSTNKNFTRKQLIRLTPKQKSNLKRQYLQEKQNSITYLDKARTNVRSNLKYLGETVESNLTKNVKTLQRLFKGEEVWKDGENGAAGSDATAKAGRNGQKVEEEVSIDWERVPSEIKSNLQSNLSSAQNWLHKVTDGMIPSSSYAGTTSDGAVNGSAATRIHQFHKAKQNQGLVMDTRWFAWNIGLALLPGVLLHVYCLSLQDEMKEYYEKMEERERLKILGIVSGDGVLPATSSSASQDGQMNNNVGGMGLSSALITEGGSSWDKMKMAFNDLFLSGVEERARQAQGQIEVDEEEPESQHSSSPSHEREAKSPESSNTATSSETSLANEVEEVAAVQMLLQRIEALEKQLGAVNTPKLSEEEQRQRDHNIEYRVKRVRQSPIQNRRDDALLARWQKEADERHVEAYTEKTSTEDTATQSSISFESFCREVSSLMDHDLNSLRESVSNQVKEVLDSFGGEEKDESKVATHHMIATDSSGSDIAPDVSTEESAGAPAGGTKQSHPSADLTADDTAEEGRRNEYLRRWWTWLRGGEGTGGVREADTTNDCDGDTAK